ncbi:hypothetical protein OKW35_000788 [Paraburkholderia sp. MM5477-R1]
MMRTREACCVFRDFEPRGPTVFTLEALHPEL